MIAKLRKKFNVYILALVAILLVSVVSILNSSISHAQTPNPRNLASFLDDNCYSTPSVLSTLGDNINNIGSLFGNGNIIGQFGMVNAIVRVPIYDWDQNPPWGQGITDSHTISFSAPRVQPIGYLEYFSATITPVPNVQWMQEYATKQAPYDLSKIAALAGIQTNVREPSPFHIANPLLYQRASVIHPNGLPNLSFRNPDFEDRSGTGTDSGEGLTEGDFLNLEDAYSISDGQIIADELGSEVIEDIRNNPGQYNNDTASRGFNFLGTPFSVNKNNPADNCREYLSNDAPMVPSYAFSVPSIGLPFTLPGTLVSPITMIAGYGPSASGITTYPRSLNGKMMLDCYGRGVQPTVIASNESIGASPRGSVNILGVRIPTLRWEGAVYFAAFLIDNAISGGSNQDIIRRLPMPKIVRENYFNGLAYLFNVQQPQQGDMPVHLRDREIDYSRSKLTSVNAQVLAARNAGHSDSNNGTTYYPNLYVKLKKPYKHIPSLGFETQKAQDGSQITVEPRIQKDGFRSSPRYSDGGNRNHPPLQNSARARIVEVVLKPGQFGREIRDEDFVGEALGSTNGIDPNQLCGFIRDKLGDPEAECDASRPEFGGVDGINLTDLPGIGGEDRTNEVNLITENEGLITRKIPAETEPGTKYCYAIYLSRQDNDKKFADADYYRRASNYNPDYSARIDKRFLSRAHCVVSGYKPSFQVRGGDLMSGGSINTQVNTKEYLANPTTLRTYGSWVEYGAFAAGPIKNLASGAGYRVGMPADAAAPVGTINTPEGETRSHLGTLSFSNNPGGHGNFGSATDGFDEIVTQLIETSTGGSRSASGDVDVSNLSSGVHILGANTRLFGSRPIDDGKSLILLAPNNAKIHIVGNIELKDSYPNESLLSQVVIGPSSTTAKFDINIEPNVNRVDSWLINPNGTINTCWLDSDDQTPRGIGWPCYNMLTVHGPVSVDTLLLRRSGSRDQNDVPPYELKQSIAGENFNLGVDAYIWAASYVSDSGRKMVTTNILDLPPRF